MLLCGKETNLAAFIDFIARSLASAPGDLSVQLLMYTFLVTTAGAIAGSGLSCQLGEGMFVS